MTRTPVRRARRFSLGTPTAEELFDRSGIIGASSSGPSAGPRPASFGLHRAGLMLTAAAALLLVGWLGGMQGVAERDAGAPMEIAQSPPEPAPKIVAPPVIAAEPVEPEAQPEPPKRATAVVAAAEPAAEKKVARKPSSGGQARVERPAPEPEPSAGQRVERQVQQFIEQARELSRSYSRFYGGG